MNGEPVCPPTYQHWSDTDLLIQLTVSINYSVPCSPQNTGVADLKCGILRRMTSCPETASTWTIDGVTISYQPAPYVEGLCSHSPNLNTVLAAGLQASTAL